MSKYTKSLRYAVLCLFYLFPFSAFSQTDNSIKSLRRELNTLKKQIAIMQSDRSADQAKVSFIQTSQPISDPGPIVLTFKHLGFTLSLFGQANFMLLHANYGGGSKVFVVTNSSSNSQLNINTTFKLFDDSKITSGSNLQFGFPLNPSESVNQLAESTKIDIDTRIMELYISHPRWGTLLLGQGVTASDDISEIDYSKTELAGYSYVPDIGGGLVLKGYDGSLVDNPVVSNFYDNLDGFGRRVRIQYNSPSLYGFQILTSFSGRSKADFVLMYKNKCQGMRIGGALALTTTNDYFTGTDPVRGNAINGSGSILFPLGTSVTVAGGYVNSKTMGRSNPSFFYGKLGQQGRFFSLGWTAVSIDYGQYKNMYFNSLATTYGLQFAQALKLLNGEFYAGYRHYHPGSELRNINLVFSGLRYYF